MFPINICNPLRKREKPWRTQVNDEESKMVGQLSSARRRIYFFDLIPAEEKSPDEKNFKYLQKNKIVAKYMVQNIFKVES